MVAFIDQHRGIYGVEGADLRGPAHRSVHVLLAEDAAAGCDEAVGPDPKG